MIVRWLGAFGAAADLETSLRYELHGHLREVAAEPLATGRRSRLLKHRSGMIGLVVARQAVRRYWRGDAWTQPDRAGYLRPTRRPQRGTLAHHECACLPIYRSVIVRGRVSPEAFRVARQVARDEGLPLLRLLPDGQTKEVRAD